MNISRANTNIIPQLFQTVYIDSVPRTDCYCTEVSLAAGQPATASLVIPRLEWDENKAAFRGRSVRVDVGYTYQTTVFIGRISETVGDVSENNVTISCQSLMGYADNVFIGQGKGTYVIEYPMDEGWTIKTVLRDIFSSNGRGSLPSDWRTLIHLGSLSILDAYWNQFPIGDISFNVKTLRDALDELMGLLGNVTWREKFSGATTYMEFFELADPTVSPINLTFGTNGNVLTITHTENTDATIDRLIGLGDKRKFVITLLSTDLIDDWDATREAVVLANPESCKPGSTSGGDGRNEFAEENRFVFRRYRIPDAIRDLGIDKENAVELSNEKQLEIQVFKWGVTPTYNGATETWEGVPANSPELLEGTEFDLENGTFTLKEPAINLVSSSLDSSNNPVDVWEEATIGITLTVNGEKIIYDTGERETVDGLTSGLTSVIENTSFQYSQMTNEDFPIDGETYTAWVYLVGTGWTVYNNKEILADDTKQLRLFTDAALRERNQTKETYSITIPFFTPVSLGTKLSLTGQDDFHYGTHQILSVSYDLTNDHSTTISTDNTAPQIANQILGAK